MDEIHIPLAGPLCAARAVLPGSKSITNRALILAALAPGRSRLTGVLDSEDTCLMKAALRSLGLEFHEDLEKAMLSLQGGAGIFPVKKHEIYVGNSGTTARFLTAMLAFSDGEYVIYGKPRMHARPIGDLLLALRSLGASVLCLHENDCPPVRIGKYRLPARDKESVSLSIPGSISSQFLSALLLTAPLAARKSDLKFHLEGELVSKPYIEMTLRMMETFGVRVGGGIRDGVFHIACGSHYHSNDYVIEPDASAASYFFAAAAVLGGDITVPGLNDQSLQGDIRFVHCLEKMGCRVTWHKDCLQLSRDLQRPLRGISIDMNAISDTAQTLAVVALFAQGRTTITNIAHIRYKETDRIAAMVKELRKFGADVTELPDGLTIDPPTAMSQSPLKINTYDDHRMAMSFAVAGLVRPGVYILDPGCTAKTYPRFFEDLQVVCRCVKNT